MTESHTCFIDVKPRPKGRPRMTRTGRTYTPADTRKFEAAVSAAWDGPLYDGPVRVAIEFHKEHFLVTVEPVAGTETSRADVDNLCKAALDGLQGHAFRNDRQVYQLEASKYTVSVDDDTKTGVESGSS